MRPKNLIRRGTPILLLLTGIMMLAQPLLAESITYLYETRAVGEIEPCG